MQAVMIKRGYHAAFEGQRKLRLKLACTANAPSDPAAVRLEADEQVVRLFSSVARVLPETDEWDLNGLLLEGQPVSRAVVVAWLNAAYQQASGEDFEVQDPDQDPACSVEGLYLLLSFADAIDSTKPLLRACCSRLQCLQLHAQLGEQQVALDTNGVSYYFGATTQKLLRQPSLTENAVYMPAAPGATTAEQQAAFKQQVAEQIEQLLWLAYRLQLQPLVQHMHSCIQALFFYVPSVLWDCEDAIFTPRVLEAAGLASLPGGKQMLINSVRGKVLKLADSLGAGPANLRPIGLTQQQQQQPLKFDAEVKCSTLRKPGATVAVELDLFGASTMKLGANTFSVQLRIGPYTQ